MADGETVGAALAIGVFGLVVIVSLQRWLPKAPGVLVAVVASVLAAVAFDLADHGVDVVGVLPQGFPPFTVPDIAAVRHRVAGRAARSGSPSCR